MAASPVSVPPFVFGIRHVCAECGDELDLTDDVVVIQIVLFNVNQGTLQYAPFLTQEQDFVYEPFFFHSGHWEEEVEYVRNDLDSDQVEPTPDEYSVCQCAMCNSGIRVNEPTLYVQYGEFHRSEREPNGERSTVFFPYDNGSEFWCLSCTRLLDSFIEMWGEGISFHGECRDCTNNRSWRDGVVCTHEQDNDEHESEQQE